MKTSQNVLSVGQYPFQVEQVDRLINNHKKLTDNPLRVAIWYDKDHKKNVYLLEVIDHFPTADVQGKPYVVEYGSSSDFLVVTGGKLYIALVSPDDFQRAVEEEWEIIKAIKNSFNRGQAKDLYSHPRFRNLVKQLK